MPKHEKLDTKRHSLAHLMAPSILEIFPEAKFGVGPVVEDGFYYDVQLSRPLTPEDLQVIEKRMREKVKQNLRFERSEMPVDSASEMFRKMSQDFKVELLHDLKTRGTTAVADLDDPNLVGRNVSEVSVYKIGPFIDLCRGPHVAATSDIDPVCFWLIRYSDSILLRHQASMREVRAYEELSEKHVSHLIVERNDEFEADELSRALPDLCVRSPQLSGLADPVP